VFENYVAEEVGRRISELEVTAKEVVDRISNKVDLERKTADEQPKSPDQVGR